MGTFNISLRRRDLGHALPQVQVRPLPRLRRGPSRPGPSNGRWRCSPPQWYSSCTSRTTPPAAALPRATMMTTASYPPPHPRLPCCPIPTARTVQAGRPRATTSAAPPPVAIIGVVAVNWQFPCCTPPCTGGYRQILASRFCCQPASTPLEENCQEEDPARKEERV